MRPSDLAPVDVNLHIHTSYMIMKHDPVASASEHPLDLLAEHDPLGARGVLQDPVTSVDYPAGGGRLNDSNTIAKR